MNPLRHPIAKTLISSLILLSVCFTAPVYSQEVQTFMGVFGGYQDDRFIMRTTEHSIGHWTVDGNTQMLNGPPQPGDWIGVDVARSGYILSVRVSERPPHRYGTVQDVNGNVVIVETRLHPHIEQWRLQDWTEMGIDRSQLYPGQQITALVYDSSHNIARIGLDAQIGSQPADPAVAPAAATDVPPDAPATGDNQAATASDQSGDLTASEAPPPLPDYDPPPCPEPDDLWTPGFWHWGPAGYFWVPGVWVAPPSPGLLWTPPFWGFAGGTCVFHAGYWGPTVGFYGGINYGGGYYGHDFVGGHWDHGHVVYNTAVISVNETVIHTTYVDRTVIQNTVVNTGNVSYTGGPSGVHARATLAELHALHERHVTPTPDQTNHYKVAAANPQLRLTNNGGTPHLAATTHPGALSGPGIVEPRRPANPVAGGPPGTPNHPALPQDSVNPNAPAPSAKWRKSAPNVAPNPPLNTPEDSVASIDRNDTPHLKQKSSRTPQSEPAPQMASAQHQAPAAQQHQSPTAQHPTPARVAAAAPPLHAQPVQHFALPKLTAPIKALHPH